MRLSEDKALKEFPVDISDQLMAFGCGHLLATVKELGGQELAIAFCQTGV